MHYFRTCLHLISFYVFFFSLFITQQALADETDSNESSANKMPAAMSINQGGFIYDIQTVDPVILAQDVEKLRSVLIRRQYELMKLKEQNEMDAGDAIIMVIIPGGLLYAGYRKHKLEQVKTALSTVSNDIRELSNDLVALQGEDTTDPMVLAQLP